jgi:hypothetical protein
MALTAKARRAIPRKDFGLPGKGSGPQGKGPGSYPLDTPGRARSALSRASANASPSEQSEIRAKVHKLYPQIKQGRGRGGAPVYPKEANEYLSRDSK